MKNLFLITILLTAAVGVAQAETITQDFDVNGGTVNMFDPALGTLDAVEMELKIGEWGDRGTYSSYGNIYVSNNVEDWGFYPCLISCAVDAGYGFDAQIVGISGTDANVTSSWESTLFMEPYEYKHLSTGLISLKTATTDLSTLLDDFVGTDELTIGTELSNWVYAEVLGASDPFASTPLCDFNPFLNIPPETCDYAGTLTYEYTPVPEPSAIILLVGLSLVGLLRRKSSRRGVDSRVNEVM